VSVTVGDVLAASGMVLVPDPGVLSAECRHLAYDSRQVLPGTLFFAFVGAVQDGRRYAPEAMARGAVAVVSDAPRPDGVTMPWIQVVHGRRALAAAAKRFYGSPDERLGVTGVTGTNGKTTCTYVIDAVLRAAGHTTTRIGTIGYAVAGVAEAAANTTPESLDLFGLLARTVEAGGQNATMEVSSHALAQGRVSGVRFHTAVFTNLTQDHLDFHGTMEAYFAAKARLFGEEFAPRFAVINSDDEYGRRIRTAAGTQVLTYGFGEGAGLRAEAMECTFSGLRFEAVYGGERYEVRSALMGEINIYNILAALGTGLSYGMKWETMLQGIQECPGVPGRFERVEAGQPFLVVVDYAHTDDALRNTLRVARRLLTGGRLITLFGCGGDRDRTKRPRMGLAAGELSDFVVLTNDNPRSEDPLGILNDVMVGLRRTDTPHTVEPDRAAAIGAALRQARPGDVVVLAGKGHETYQVTSTGTIDFDDRVVARAELARLGYAGGRMTVCA
jgi:UDP-N-acetylmuramoyl-L-alanyl-D-glutamate--2,6-diaminopimelate ligase